jgi:hypothetical protein
MVSELMDSERRLSALDFKVKDGGVSTELDDGK